MTTNDFDKILGLDTLPHDQCQGCHKLFTTAEVEQYGKIGYHPQCNPSVAASVLGSIKSAKKAASSRENGKRGGRPAKFYSVRKNGDADLPRIYANAFTVEYTDAGGRHTLNVHTDLNGDGLWINGQQTCGTCQFDAGRNAYAAYRRYFSYLNDFAEAM